MYFQFALQVYFLLMFISWAIFNSKLGTSDIRLRHEQHFSWRINARNETLLSTPTELVGSDPCTVTSLSFSSTPIFLVVGSCNLCLAFRMTRVAYGWFTGKPHALCFTGLGQTFLPGTGNRAITSLVPALGFPPLDISLPRGWLMPPLVS